MDEGTYHTPFIFTGAAEGLGESLASRRRLAAADPGNAEWARDLIISNVKLTQIADDPAAKRKSYAAA